MDHAYHPERSVACCRRMLTLWLQQIPLPTWGKLVDAINEVEEDIKVDIGGCVTGLKVGQTRWPSNQLGLDQ